MRLSMESMRKAKIYIILLMLDLKLVAENSHIQ
jgi:hypothetical protein